MFTTPYKLKVDPQRDKDRNEKLEPTCIQSRKLTEVPSVAMAYVDIVDPILKNDRQLRQDPQWPKSSSEIALPICVKPYTENVTPSRAQLRRLIPDPV